MLSLVQRFARYTEKHSPSMLFVDGLIRILILQHMHTVICIERRLYIFLLISAFIQEPTRTPILCQVREPFVCTSDTILAKSTCLVISINV